MTERVLLALVVMSLAVLATLMFVVRYPLRFAHRKLRCPTRNLEAEVTFRRREVGFLSVAATDVTACSLYPGQSIGCAKECLK